MTNPDLHPQISVAGALQELNTYLPAEAGEYFGGIGVKFTTYKVLNSFVLLVIQFGDELEFDVLGQSTYVAPNPSDPEPDAMVQLDIIGSYKAAEGALLIRGQLSSDSFVLSRQCHLQGGFAVATWFRGIHSGDFVFCFGGYPAHYKAPAHYPQHIPRLGFLWQITDDISIKGLGYWVITPRGLMAGGSLQAAYRTSWIHASFCLAAAFEFDWCPLHYEGYFSESFSIEVKVDLLFCSKWLGFEISRGFEVHGPPFGGSVSMDLGVCTVHIDFGASPAPKPLLSGPEFAQSFLPEPTSSDSLISLSIEQGLLKKEKNVEGKEIFFVNPKALVIRAESVVPTNQFKYQGKSVSSSNPKFQIVPMGKQYDQAHRVSTLSVCITDEDGQRTDQFACKVLHKNAPKSIWRTSDSDDQSSVNPLDFGIKITPAKSIPASSTSTVNLNELANEDFIGHPYQWTTPMPLITDRKSAKSVKSGGINQEVFQTLQKIFPYPDQTEADYNGLPSRLKAIGTTELFTVHR
ncbi:MAG: hypothetical protein GKR96_08350 [Gammaproteobacteria bacterium]|nr:hypothetical protein [Gammaproteobacteria bacterium]